MAALETFFLYFCWFYMAFAAIATTVVIGVLLFDLWEWLTD